MSALGAHDAGPGQKVDDGMARVFQLFGKRWTGLIVAVLLPHPVRFADLRRAIPGISERMLSDRLTELGAAGLVVREVDEGPPLRVSYGLTEAGAALEPALKELGNWAEKHLRAQEVIRAGQYAPGSQKSLSLEIPQW
ncbi:helix-turn-helix transcriptional regulator [Streptomyces sp. NBC_01571]|uniref:winged helix-turn-helix transcriptional regulator n=1 Tax=Streptomyces sp. NBC_01571 TaxID=2975883 RepID=UPI00225882F7|nr:helix-turn-helix domain-containing protein [Streptomyces sp. NBC_01571]MCX4579890.1 helix-turn-helix transcriptional regulator [Streptomyces sp. NBC_01571]